MPTIKSNPLIAAFLFMLITISSGLSAESALSGIVVKGMFGDALNAADQAVQTAKALSAYKSFPLTVELWCKINDHGDRNILASNEPEESATHWGIFTENITGVLCANIPGFKPGIIRTSKNIVDGQWHYIAMVLDAQNIALFVDAREEARMALSQKPGGNIIEGPLLVGQAINLKASFNENCYCDGLIDDVRISNCVREVNKMPHAPFIVDAQTVGLWSFDLATSAREFADASTNHNPMLVEFPGPSMSETDRSGYKAGPAPLGSEAQNISLRKGTLEMPAPAPVFSLDGEWQMVEGGSEGERLSDTWANVIKAPVPGSVHTALHQGGIIPHPYLEKNQISTRPWSFKTYYYKKTFPRPPKGQDETLVFGGICNRCTIWLNGKQLGQHEGMFNSISYPVSDLLEDKNTLIVKLEPANPEWETTVVFNNSYGWLYSMFPPLGIWRSVSIHGEPRVKMQSPFVATKNAKDGIVDLVTTITGAESGWAGKLMGVVTPDNFSGETFSFEQDVESKSDPKEVHLRFKVPDPKLWWPVDMGDPNLYKLHLALVPKKGGWADVREITFGIRTVEMAPVNGIPSPKLFDWTFVINGQPMFVKGTGWCTPDVMMDFSRARYDRFLSMAASQHIQMLRAWGCGMVETEDFYDLCDRKGIMVMQEWPTAWNSHNKQPFDLLERTVREGTLRLRNHPSLVIYGGGNESNKPFGPAIDMMGKLSIELDGTRDFHRAEAYGGSVHDYVIQLGGGTMDHAFSMKAIFWGEFGIASYPCHESVQRFLPKNEKNVWPAPLQKPSPEYEKNTQPAPGDGSFAFHTPAFNTYKEVFGRKDMAGLSAMSQLFTTGTTMEQFVIGTQLAQAVGVRHVLERARTRWPKCTGALYYKLNDNCPAASWSTVDWYGAPKISHYLMQDSYSPLVAVILFQKASSYGLPLSLPVYLLDDADALKGASWEVRVRAYGADLKQIKETQFSGKGSITKVKPLGEFTLDEAQTRTTPLLMVLDVMKNGVMVQRNYNFTNFEPVKDCLFNLPKSSVTMRIEGGKAVLKNTGKLPTVGVNIGRPGHLDTFTVEDNYFWLDAGESKTVKVSDVEGLVVDAWNIEKASKK